jgi:prolyl 4-hydroxylase
MKRSKIGTKHEINEIRTSSGVFLERGENELVERIENRVSEIMNIPMGNAEELHILNYKIGQEYKAHYDYFTSKNVENNRISTLIMYLNDVEEGGETIFPNLDLKISPRRGNAVYFEYFYGDQELNELTLHSGTPVIKGEKWAATQWMRRKRIK